MKATDSTLRQIQQSLSQDNPLGAEKIARAALSQTPGDATVLQLLGVALIQTNRPVEAEQVLRESIDADPNQMASQSALAIALRRQRRFADAALPMHRAWELAPDNIDIGFSLADILKEAGQIPQAIAVAQLIIQKAPQNASAYNLLGTLHLAAGDVTAAMLALEHCIALQPRRFDAYMTLGSVLRRMRRLEDAEKALQRSLTLNPQFAASYANLGLVYKDMGRLSDAENCYRKALQLDPKMTGVYTNLGLVLAEFKQYDAAEQAYQRAPRNPPTLTNWGNLYREQGRITDSITLLQEAVAMDPTYIPALNNLALSLQLSRQVEAASKCLARLIQLSPDDMAVCSNFLMTLNCLDRFTPQQVFEEHVRFGTRFDRSAGLLKTSDPSRGRLRIAYLSPDFCRHSVAWFIEPILANHDRQKFEVVVYADVQRPDDVTARLKSLCEHWIPVHGLSDAQLVNRILDDRIDILVDLSGHGTGNRMGVLAHKPANVQVTYLGYPNTTGLSAVDYRLTDAVADPVGKTDEFNVEKLYRLPRGFLCYAPPAHLPDVGPLPAEKTGVITFGSFNNLIKLSDTTLKLWARILSAVPNSRLLLKSQLLGDIGLQKPIDQFFAAQGIPADRLVYHEFDPSFQSHLQTYNHVDIALEPMPYNGTTTTIEALLMGVPTITQAGPTHVSRVGASIMSAMQLNTWIAESQDQYVELAMHWASDLPRLAQVRSELRAKLLASPLTDAPGFTRELEAAYLEMWQAKMKN